MLLLHQWSVAINLLIQDRLRQQSVVEVYVELYLAEKQFWIGGNKAPRTRIILPFLAASKTAEVLSMALTEWVTVQLNRKKTIFFIEYSLYYKNNMKDTTVDYRLNLAMSQLLS